MTVVEVVVEVVVVVVVVTWEGTQMRAREPCMQSAKENKRDSAGPLLSSLRSKFA